MRASIIVAILLLSPTSMLRAQTVRDSPRISEAELVHRTQLLYDAIAPGNRAPWQKYLADDALIFDEQGHSYDKSGMIATITGLPPGFSGTIHVLHVKSRFAPNVAILSYDMDETETVFGTVLHASYHATDTWLYRKRAWQIAASQVLRYYEDPAVGSVSASALEEYVGTYELALGKRLTITHEGTHLFSQRDSSKPVELLPESADMFFIRGAEGRRLFHRDASGKVDSLIQRRNNEDLVWKRVP